MNFGKQKTTKYQKLMKWVKTNRIKSSLAIFIVLVGVGSLGLTANYFFKKQPQAATTQATDHPLVSIPGWWFNEHFGKSICDTEECKDDADPDFDKLTNLQEFYYNANPVKSDTNSNGLTDGEDVAFGYAPNKPGKITFEEATSDDSIVGESLLYSEDIKEVINSMSDLDKIAIPEVNESELNISQDISQQAFTTYMLALDAIAKKYYPTENYYGFLETAIKSQDVNTLDSMKTVAANVVAEYKQITVPANLLNVHKHQILLWTILPDVITVPQVDTTNISQLFNNDINAWYDKVQVMIALNQKLELEIRDLRKQYEFEIEKK